MRKRLIILSTLLLGVSCNSEIHKYIGDDGIYFAVKHVAEDKDPELYDYQEQTNLSFMVENTDSKVIDIKVNLMGDVTAQDRHFTVVVNQEESTALSEDFKSLDAEYIMPANSHYTTIPITFYRTASLKDQERKLVIDLVESSDFKLKMPFWQKNSTSTPVNVIRHSIIFSDKLVKLPGFSEWYFGTFSEKKLNLMMSLFNLTYEDFKDEMNYLQSKVYAQNLDKYLQEQSAVGNTIYEDEKDSNGNSVKMSVGKGAFL